MRKIYKILLIVFGILLIVLSIAVHKIDSLLETVVRQELDKMIERTDSSFYYFEYQDVDFHVWDGDIEISGVKILPKNGMRDSVDAGVLRSIVSASFQTISVKGLSFWKYYKTKHILIDEIIILEPEMVLTLNPNVKKVKRKAFNPAKLLSPKLKSIYVENIEFQNLNFELNNVLRKNLMLKIDSLNLGVGDVVFDSLSIKKKVPLLFSQIYLSVQKLAVNISEYYMLKTNNFVLDSRKNLMQVDSIRIIPKYSQREFDQKIPYEKGWIKIDMGQFRIEGFNIDSIREKQKIYLQKIYLNNPNIITYKNKKLKDPPYKYQELISQVIREIPVDFKVDTLIAKNAFIRIQNIGDRVPQTLPANIDFKSGYIKITGITNDSTFVKDKPIINVAFYSRFMGAADLNVHLSLPVFHANNYFTVDAKLSELNGQVMNELLNRLLLLSIKSGTILSTELEFAADNDSAYGFIDLSYRDLKLDMKSTDDPQKSVVFVNALLNTVAKNNNIKGQAGFSRGFIAYKRKPTDKFFKYLWKAVQTGIINTLLPAKAVKEQSKQFKKDNKKGIKQDKKDNKQANKNK
ncbi:MAG: hypothetical protein L3J74_02380 [Bacteroidales bacterium]|nr:hypothetical protein [Bacteroidales bacterium]